MVDILFTNLDLLDTEAGVLRSGCQVLVRGRDIAEVAKGSIHAPGVQTVDLAGRTLMPGLIDCHVHVTARGGLDVYPKMLPSLVTAHAGDILRGMLMRGFTTVRDAAGADAGHRQAVEQGIFMGPRLLVCGRAISQTGGHGDGRTRADMADPCDCAHIIGGIGRIADGVSAVRRAVRDELRLGADQIKIMAGGGVGSAADPIDMLQYGTDELEAAVDEARRSHTYVLAHVYTDAGIRRAVEAGVRTIEHGNFLGEATAALMARIGAYLVPTLITYRVGETHGRAQGRSEEALAKSRYVLSVGTRSLEIAKRAGVKMAYGTDLFFGPHSSQPGELLVRAEVLTAAEVIRSATVTAAEVVRMVGKVGIVAPGALADLLAVDGNPLEDLGLLQDEGAHMSMIMKDGCLVKNGLAATAN